MKNRILKLLVLFFIVLCTITSQNKYVYAKSEAITDNVQQEKQIQAYKCLIGIQRFLLTDPQLYMRKYNTIVNTYSSYLDTPKTIDQVYDTEEIDIIKRCVETETHGADFSSKVNVANVILNRVNSDRFGNTPKEVVMSPGQFSYSARKIDPLTTAAVEFAFVNIDTTQGALFFHSGKKTDTFNNAKYIFTDAAGHHFYK